MKIKEQIIQFLKEEPFPFNNHNRDYWNCGNHVFLYYKKIVGIYHRKEETLFIAKKTPPLAFQRRINLITELAEKMGFYIQDGISQDSLQGLVNKEMGFWELCDESAGGNQG